MQSSRLIFFFKIWAVAFATTLYFAQASIAQSPEQRLIPLSELNEKNEEEQQLPRQDFVVYGRAENSKDAGIAPPPQVDYRPIPLALDEEFDEKRQRNLERMPDLESFFTFGGTLELLTPLSLSRLQMTSSKNWTSSSANSCGVWIQALKIPL